MGQDHVGLQGNQLFREYRYLGARGGEANFDAEITVLRPSELLNVISKSCKAGLGFRIVLGKTH
jgi:hypothetical protein